MNLYKNKKGFTLVELLVVVSIIGVLASLTLVSLQGARAKARDSKLISELFEFKKALELYKLTNNAYPGTAGIHYVSIDNCITPGDVQYNSIFNDDFNTQFPAASPRGYPCRKV